MEIDRFPLRTSVNSRHTENLPSINSVFGDQLGVRNNGNPGPLFSANSESDPRVPFKAFSPSEFPSWGSGEYSRPSIHFYRREGPNHQHPPHYDHRRGSPVGRSPGLGAFPQYLYSPKPAGYGNTRDSWYLDHRQEPSPRASGVPPVSGHVQQQQQPQAQQHLPPPQLNPINTWPPKVNISNSSSSGADAAPTARSERPYPRRLSSAAPEPDQCTNVNDSDAGTENGDSQSDFTSSAAEATYSRSGSSPLPRHFSCVRCKIGFKCDSLRRKHEMKHTKPFKCEVLGCKRALGFSSINDRNRHMNSVHKMNVSGNAIGYDCQYDNCRENNKIFFRLDNFRNHLKKKHGPTKATGGELEEFLKRAESECRRKQPVEYLTPSPSSTQSLDTRSEPGFSDFSSTPVAAESPGPISPTFRIAQREAPPMPGFSSVPETSLRHVSSANDRNCHMNLVHEIHVPGNVVSYCCQYGNCHENGKTFHGLDSFRSHLQKRHGPTKATRDEMEEFLKRAETECQRLHSRDHLTPSPSQPRVPSVPGLPSVPEPIGHGTLPPLPIGGKAQEVIDPSSDPMDLDEEEPLSGFNTAGSKQRGPSTVHSYATTLANTERGAEAIDTNSQATARRNKILELTEIIDRLTKERDGLLYQEQAGPHESYPKQPQEARGKATSKGMPLGRIEENHPGHTREDGEPGVLASGERSGTSHALRGYIQQEPTRDPFPARLFDPNADTHPSATEAVEEECSHVLSPQVATAAPPPTGMTTATEVSQRTKLLDSRQVTSSTMPSGPWIQRRPGSPAKQTTLRFSVDRNLTHPKMKPAGAVKGPAICPTCAKSFGRPSELKKHMKRHSRPFACTFHGCGKSFGSKNDWKRHENSQHFQLELWKCPVIASKSSSLCGKLSFRRESHITHLKNAHNITDKGEITEYTNGAHIGRNNFKTFWCGFCSTPGVEARGRVVPLEKRGLEGWDERFDHLGNHFEEGELMKNYSFHEEGDFGDAPSTEGDDEDEDAGDEDEAMPDSKLISSVPPPSRADVIMSTSEAAQAEPGETLQPVKPFSEKKRKTERNWYCCDSQHGGHDLGPYNETIHDSCIECGHQRCVKCKWENVADKE